MPISQTGIAARRCASDALPYAASTCVEATTGTPSLFSRIFSQAGFLDPPPAVYTCAMNTGQWVCLTYLAQCSKGSIPQHAQQMLWSEHETAQLLMKGGVSDTQQMWHCWDCSKPLYLSLDAMQLEWLETTQSSFIFCWVCIQCWFCTMHSLYYMPLCKVNTTACRNDPDKYAGVHKSSAIPDYLGQRCSA